MSNFTEGNHITRAQAADLSAKQYYLVKTNAARQAVLAAAAGDFIVGVVATAPLTSTVGDEVDIAVRNGSGTQKVVAGAAFSFGAYLAADSTGRAVAVTPVAAGAQPTQHVFGYALEAATAAGQVVEFTWFDALI